MKDYIEIEKSLRIIISQLEYLNDILKNEQDEEKQEEIIENYDFSFSNKIENLLDKITDKLGKVSDYQFNLSMRNLERIDTTSNTYLDEQRKLSNYASDIIQYEMQINLLEEMDYISFDNLYNIDDVNNYIELYKKIKYVVELMVDSLDILDGVKRGENLETSILGLEEKVNMEDDKFKVIFSKYFDNIKIRNQENVKIINNLVQLNKERKKFSENLLKELDFSLSLEENFTILMDKIKNKEIEINSKINLSSSVINNIFYYKPRNINDLKKISGIDEQFVYNYGNKIIYLFNYYLQKGSKDIFLNDSEKEVLEKMKNRLVYLNQRNKLLYSGKLQTGRTFDLFNLLTFEKIDNLLFGNCMKACIYKFEVDKDGKIIGEKTFRSLNKLERENHAIIKDSGVNVLYIAYPYLEGKLTNDDINIKAPLVLFPVNLFREKNNYYLIKDNSRDIIYNTTLILANNKANSKNAVLPDDVVDFVSSDTFYNDIINFYKNNNLELSIQDSNYDISFVNFFESTFREFQNYQNGELYIKKYVTVGLFPKYVTSIYSDFQKIIENNRITYLLRKLLSATYGLNHYNNKNEIVIHNNKIDNGINYISDLDYSQELIMKNIRDGKSLVIQGPPGTGKSQVIVNIIIQAIMDNKKVLMVSEKKAALDVIYSRLGDLSRYTILLDDMSDKNEFFQQMKKIVEADEYGYNYFKNNTEIYNKQVNVNIDKLIDIEQKIYKNNSFGKPMYDLYHMCKKYDMNNEKDFMRYKYLENVIDYSFYQLNYETLFNLKRNFDAYSHFDFIVDYINISQKYNMFIFNIRDNITEYEQVEYVKEGKEILQYIQKYNSLNALKKFIKKNELINKINDYFEQLFKNNVFCNDICGIEKIVQNIIEFLPVYNHYFDCQTKYLDFSQLEREWINLILNICKNYNESYAVANDFIYQHILYKRIEEFEKNNRATINYIDSFDSIIENIDKAIVNKKNAVFSEAGYMLKANNDNLSLNGNIKEINRQVNRTRYGKINEFIDKYKLEIMDSVKIWLLTPEVVSSIFPLDEKMFDIVIFDEASQLFVEKGIPAIYRAKQVVIAGDEKQLRPSLLGAGRIQEEEGDINDDYSGALEEESLLSLAAFRFEEKTLDFHYRAKYEELINFSNYAFYNMKLRVAPNRQKLIIPPIQRIMVEDGFWFDKQNEVEAKEVVQLVKHILNTRTNNQSIGIITFNSSQKDLIYDLLEREKEIDMDFSVLLDKERDRKENEEDRSLFVKNIENVQGDERDIIIFSIGYAKGENGKVQLNFGWLNQQGGENRLNVAISRAKEKIYVVTSIEPEELKVDATKNRGPKIFKEYLRYVRAVSDNNYKLAESILSCLDGIYQNNDDNVDKFDSEFEEEVCTKLRALGYNVDTQVGTGSYKIDLAVLDDNNNYILGIECDGRMYHSSMAARERDYHRQKFLESRGWKIYRIWSNKWWYDSDKEIKNLDNYIKTLIDKSKVNDDDKIEVI